VAALQEMNRVVKPGGYLLITAPFCSLTHFSPYHFSTGFNKYFYLHHLEAAGYTFLDLQENGNFFEWLAQEIMRMPSIGEQYAQEKLTIQEKLALNTMLKCLDRLSSKGGDSKELLCFGYFVFARKQSAQRT
jgi:ubiquinone/menaquinone biosynthesis C-methylase UbiE